MTSWPPVQAETREPGLLAAPARIHTPGERPMSIVFFTSSGGNNLQTALRVADECPAAMSVDAIVADRYTPEIASTAWRRGIPLVAYDFGALCGPVPARNATTARAAYERRRDELHTKILHDLYRVEEINGFPFDLAVLAYRRIVRGPLYERFRDKMINQHPGDLTVRTAGRRTLIGTDPVGLAQKLGHKATRTTTFLVNSGVDTGEILCQGPEVPFDDPASSCVAHEAKQKRLSDTPALVFALNAISAGRYAVGPDEAAGGLRRIYYDNCELPYGGVSLV